MTIGSYEVSMFGIVLGAVAAVWAVTLLIGIVSWERKKGRVRTTDVFVLIVSVILGGVWMFALQPKKTVAAPTVVAASMTPARVATCAVITAGETEEKVKAKLGEPDEIRSEEETRGPGSNVWIYRDSRCAIRFFGSTVESIE